jgi:hypothetical protein
MTGLGALVTLVYFKQMVAAAAQPGSVPAGPALPALPAAAAAA